MPPSPYSFAILFTVAALCILFVGIDKSGLGSGLGVLATPLMTLVLTSTTDAIGIILPVMCVCDLFALRHYWTVYDRRNLRLMLPGSLVGIALASLLLWLLRDQHAGLDRLLKIIIGISCLLFVAWQWLPKRLLKRREGRPPHTLAASTAGLVSGFTSALAHAGGPPATMFLLPQGLELRVFIGTTVWFFAITNFLKLIPYAALGFLRPACLLFSLTLLPLAPLGILIGIWLRRRINQEIFRNIVLTVLLLTGLQFLSGYNIASLLRLLHR